MLEYAVAGFVLKVPQIWSPEKKNLLMVKKWTQIARRGLAFVYTGRECRRFCTVQKWLNAVVWFCLLITSKTSKVPLTKTVTLTVCVNEALDVPVFVLMHYAWRYDIQYFVLVIEFRESSQVQ